jgi:hypothetical protein
MSRLPPNKEKAALLIAEGWKQVDVAAELHVDPSTITRWRKETDFKLRLGELVEDLTSQSIVYIREKVLDNVKIVQDIATNGGEPGIVSSRLKAALWLVDRVIGTPDKEGKLARQKQGAEAKLLKLPDEDLEELAERGEGE